MAPADWGRAEAPAGSANTITRPATATTLAIRPRFLPPIIALVVPLGANPARDRPHDPALVAKRRDQGFRMITIGYDLQPMLAGLYRAINEGRNS